MNVKEYILNWYSDEEGLIVFDGLDEAFVGIGYIFNTAHVCYNKDKIIEILTLRDGMIYEEAIEFFDFNIAGAYLGEQTPIILEDII